MKTKFINKIRERREHREFVRVYEQASDTMRQELLAMAQRQGR
jgi:hypothetical protein